MNYVTMMLSSSIYERSIIVTIEANSFNNLHYYITVYCTRRISWNAIT